MSGGIHKLWGPSEVRLGVVKLKEIVRQEFVIAVTISPELVNKMPVPRKP